MEKIAHQYQETLELARRVEEELLALQTSIATVATELDALAEWAKSLRTAGKGCH